MTPLAIVAPSVGNAIGVDVAIVSAAVHAQLGRQHNGGNEEEQRVDQVEQRGQHRGLGERLAHRRGNKIEERQQRKDRHEHGEVDRGVVAGYRLMNHVAHERQDEERQ